MKKSEKSLLTKLGLICIALILLGVAGYFGFQFYQNYKDNKIYSVGEVVTFPGFEIKITKASFKDVNLELSKEYTNKYGPISKKENCNEFSKAPTYLVDENLVREGVSGDGYGPSKYNICNRRNDYRDHAKKYIDANSQLVLDYIIKSNSIVDSKAVKFTLTPDSGRDVKKSPELYLGAFKKGAEEHFFKYGPEGGNLNGKTVYSLYGDSDYNYDGFYGTSDLSGDINKGLERTGYLYTDIRKTEKNVDLKVSYKGQTRIVRISR